MAKRGRPAKPAKAKSKTKTAAKEEGERKAALPLLRRDKARKKQIDEITGPMSEEVRSLIEKVSRPQFGGKAKEVA